MQSIETTSYANAMGCPTIGSKFLFECLDFGA